ncbi:Gfo/Idh/MocA family protein [Lacticaseibacillus absianus]|uniref:Gfo/Idh/MocA family protein n=1 Tax=Lacticaseibacillus absianus TaxID=2729623 RepID=UPI0015C91B35|nr:Gfo/Idh/MocA family oxidoreductase [Lacticaseibacillus absianus]
MSALTMGVIGYGGMGSYHCQTLIPAEPNVKLVGVYDIAPAQRAAATQAGLKAYATLDDLLADPGIALVLIATPNDTHKALAIAALEHGKHVMVEKPAMMSSAEFSAVLAVADKVGRQVFVHQNRRWDPDFRVVTAMVQAQLLGDVFHIESRIHGANGIPGDWRHDRAAGGGMVLDWGVHLLDQLLFLFPAPISRVQARLSHVLGNEVEDGCTVELTFATGLTALIEVGTTNYVKLPRWYIQGTTGTAFMRHWEQTGEVVVATGVETQAPAPIKAGVGLTKTMAPPTEGAVRHVPFPAPAVLEPSIYQNIVSVLNDGATPIVKNSEVLRVLRLMETIFAAAAAHQSLPFDAVPGQ